MMEEDSGSELSELEDTVEEMEEDEETRRPNFVRAATDAGKKVEQSTQEFFRRRPGNASMCSAEDDNISTPGQQGALVGSLAAAAASPQQAGWRRP